MRPYRLQELHTDLMIINSAARRLAVRLNDASRPELARKAKRIADFMAALETHLDVDGELPADPQPTSKPMLVVSSAPKRLRG